MVGVNESPTSGPVMRPAGTRVPGVESHETSRKQRVGERFQGDRRNTDHLKVQYGNRLLPGESVKEFATPACPQKTNNAESRIKGRPAVGA